MYGRNANFVLLVVKEKLEGKVQWRIHEFWNGMVAPEPGIVALINF